MGKGSDTILCPHHKAIYIYIYYKHVGRQTVGCVISSHHIVAVSYESTNILIIHFL